MWPVIPKTRDREITASVMKHDQKQLGASRQRTQDGLAVALRGYAKVYAELERERNALLQPKG